MKLEVKGTNSTHDLFVREQDIIVLDGNMVTVARDNFNWTYVLTDESVEKVKELLNE